MKVVFKDIDMNFTKHPITNDVSKLVNNRAITQSLDNLVNMGVEDVVMRNGMGVGLKKMLFKNINPLVIKEIKDKIKFIIDYYEKRISLESIDVRRGDDSRGIIIDIEYYIYELEETFNYNINMSRVK